MSDQKKINLPPKRFFGRAFWLLCLAAAQRIAKTRQDKTTLFNQGSPVSCKAGILRGPGFNKTYIYTFTIKLQGTHISLTVSVR